jgi:hypothetical protein
MHRDWCSKISATLVSRNVQGVTYGRAAKLVAVYLKTIVLMGSAADSSLGHYMHPPIDRRLLQGLAASTRMVSPHKAEWRTISWTKLDQEGYFALVQQLRAALPTDAPFWTIEEYWEPSDWDD